VRLINLQSALSLRKAGLKRRRMNILLGLSDISDIGAPASELYGNSDLRTELVKVEIGCVMPVME
jgi:hypothetical protein